MNRRTDLTVIYYTANREDEVFERNICGLLIENSDGLPIVSVSQKPTNLGNNICVGEVGVSGHNVYRQMQIAAKAATTKYVCTAESDCLYPKEYFEFVPPCDDRAYRAMPLLVAFCQRGYKKYCSRKPRGSESAMIVSRKLLIDGIEKMLDGWGEWGTTDCNGDSFPYLFKTIGRDSFEMDIPVITFKTDNNMHRRTPHKVDDRIVDIPYWGNIHDLISRIYS